MPYYTYKCTKCGKEDYEIREVEKRNDPKFCKEILNVESRSAHSSAYYSTVCGGEMKLKIGNPTFKIKHG